MPLRPVAEGSFFHPEFVSPTCLEPGGIAWLLARFGAQWFPAWLFVTWRGKTGRGRDAWPATVLTSLVVLRWSEQGMSRRASVARAATDMSWRAAMGLELGGPTPSEKTVRDFEKFLQGRHGTTQVPRYLLLHEHIVRACMSAGVGVTRRASWATDSTPMWCYGAVRDTVRLLGDGLRSLAATWARATRRSLATVAEEWQLPFLEGKSTKGAFTIEWRDEKARAGVTHLLAESLVRVVGKLRHGIEGLVIRESVRKRILRISRHLLRVVEQDLEPGEGGQLTIAKKVAADRLVSFTDPQARHGRKSKSQTFEGFKVHVLGDVVSGLLLSLGVTSGNVHDGQPAHRLIRRAKDLAADLKQVMGDTAYGGAKLRHVVRETLGVTLLAPPPPVESKEGRVGRAAFSFDFDRREATCPNGEVSADRRTSWSAQHEAETPTFAWPKETCDRCPLSTSCRGNARGGHRVVLHPYEQELREARETWKDPEVRAAYRERSQCERLINEVTRHGGRTARSFGLRNAQVQVHAIAMACNLRLLARALAEQENRAHPSRAA